MFICSFTSYAEIVEYVSEVGNNEVPYPHAVDSNGDYYFINDKVVVSNIPEDTEDSPYTYYHHSKLITVTEFENKFGPKIAPMKDFLGIKKYYVDDDERSLFYVPDPESRFNWFKERGRTMYVVYDEKIGKVALTEEEYVNIITKLGETNGYRPIMNVEKITERFGGLVSKTGTKYAGKK